MNPKPFFGSVSLAAALLVSSVPLYAAGKVRIVVSVDWEGREIAPNNLEAMKAFRKDYPEIPIQHFLNAAYFTKKDADPKVLVENIRSVLKADDLQGLHIHAWRSLITASGVEFRKEPAFRGPLDLEKCTPDCGHDVNLTAYSESEMRRVIRFSLDTLTKQGFDRATTFRAGAWQSDKKVFRALVAEGITQDASATDAEYLREKWGKSLLYPVVGKIWPNTQKTTQPYAIDLGDGKSIIELPNNGCLADYTNAEINLAAFQKNAELLKANPDKDVYLSIGFHQETAEKYLPGLRQGIDAIKTYAGEQKIPFEFIVPKPGVNLLR